jgi:hypothetical protein
MKNKAKAEADKVAGLASDAANTGAEKVNEVTQ